jgi:ornithine carbamoyltransferase
MVRTTDHANLQEIVEASTIPVINGLTKRSHPCQLMADVLTLVEIKGPIRNRVVAWCGDGNNMAVSWIHAAVQFDFELRLACPKSHAPSTDVLDWATTRNGRVRLVSDPLAAVAAADCVVTDTWVSMGDTDAASRRRALKPFQVNAALMKHAAKDAIFMHCLPAHRGDEVTDDVIDGPQSVVFDEAENRLHAQKAILQWCLSGAKTG